MGARDSGPKEDILMKRRDFVQTLGAAAMGQVLQPRTPSLYPRAPIRKLDRIGLQLYTVRHEMEKDVDATIAKVAAAGYQEVEFAGYFGKSPADVKALLDHHGLAAQAHDAGLQFAYHNHDFEFVPMEGSLPYDVLLEATDPKLVQLEIDLYWITKGGQDPLKYFARWPGRIPLVHVKDSGGPPDNKMMDVGAGTIDWKKIFAREDQAGIRHAFVEHDQPADAFASIKASCDYLKRLEF